MTEETQAAPPWTRRPGIVVAVGFLLVLALFWPTLTTFPGTWARYGMGHGWFVAALVAWVLWSERPRLLDGPSGDTLLLLPLIGVSLLWFVATVAYIQVVHQVAFVLLLVLWGLLVLGRRVAAMLVALGATFLLALPMWGPLVPPLRRATTLVSGGLVRLLGIEAEIQGDVIHIAVGTFLVEDGCAGLNYLIAGLVIGAFYAFVLLKGWKARLAVMTLAAIIAIVGNWIRVASLIVIGHVSQMQSPLVEQHIGFGWVVFTVGLIPFFLLARKVQRWEANDRTAIGSEGPAEARSDVAPLRALEDGVVPADQSEDPGDGGVPPASAPGLGRVAWASGLAALGPLLYFGFGALPAASVHDMDPEDLVLGQDWGMIQSQEARSLDWQPEYRGATLHQRWAFTDGTDRVHVDRFAYREQSQGAKLVGYPNRIAPPADILDHRTVGPVDRDRRLWVRQALVRGPEGPIVTWYWYRVGGVDTFSPVHAKALEVPSFLRGHRVSELLVLSSPCGSGDCRDALRALAGLMGVEVGTASDPDPVPSAVESDREQQQEGVEAGSGSGTRPGS